MGCINGNIKQQGCLSATITRQGDNLTGAVTLVESPLDLIVTAKPCIKAAVTVQGIQLVPLVKRIGENIRASVSLVCSIAVRKRARYKVTNGYYKLKDKKYYSVWKR